MLPMECITKRDYAIRFNVLIIFVLNILGIRQKMVLFKTALYYKVAHPTNFHRMSDIPEDVFTKSSMTR